MASAAGGGGGDGFADASDRVYAAVASGKSDEEVPRVIAECGNEQQRKAAVNATDRSNDETPLAAAHRLQRGDLIGALLEAGADASKLFRRSTPLVLCIAYGLVDSLRALLKAGHDPNQWIEYVPHDSLEGRGFIVFSTAAHLCLAPPRLSPGGPEPPPQLACFAVLVQEGKANLSARDSGQHTLLHWLAGYVPPGPPHLAELDLLVRLGADVEARSDSGETPVFRYAETGYLAGLKRLIGHGFSVNYANRFGFTPLMSACFYLYAPGPDRRAVALELAARRSSAAHNWRGHEAMVGLALDMGELKDAEKEVEENLVRVAALELELCELGAGTESSGSESESEGEGDDDDDDDDDDDESEEESEEEN
jgi:ankyrin repeat protein